MHLPRGELLFTKLGISGPVILDMSQNIVEIMEKYGDLKLYIDLKPEIEQEALEIQLVKDFQNHSKKNLEDYLKNYLTESMIYPILKIISLDPQKKLNEITEKERLQLRKR